MSQLGRGPRLCPYRPAVNRPLLVLRPPQVANCERRGRAPAAGSPNGEPGPRGQAAPADMKRHGYRFRPTPETRMNARALTAGLALAALSVSFGSSAPNRTA